MSRRMHRRPARGSSVVFLSLSVVLAGICPPSAGASEPASGPARDASQCRAHANIDACYDVIRRDPRDPVLLVALGDALLHAGKRSGAARAYRRAQDLAPSMPGLTARISQAESVPPARATTPAPSMTDDPARRAPQTSYSNLAPDGQTH